MSKTVKVIYDAEKLTTEITVDGQPFDTSRINGKEIADWAYPFMMRKVQWNGFYDEMVEALGGEAAFNLVFEGSDEALAELKEAWEDVPVTIVSGENTVIVKYNEIDLTTEIIVNGQSFDTSRLIGKEVADWAYPFMIRKIKWNGFYDEMVEALGTAAFNLVFYGSETALAELQEALGDVPVTIVSDEKVGNFVTIEYHSEPLITNITVNGKTFDTARIEGKELADWVYPFMIRKIKWDGIFEELRTVIESETYAIRFIGSDQDLEILKEACPETVSISAGETIESSNHQNPPVAAFDSMSVQKTPTFNKEAGDLYQNGKSAFESHNYIQAVQYFKKSADAGHDEAQFALGDCYRFGLGVTQDNSESLKWYAKSAEQGNSRAQFEVACCFYHGEGVNKDHDTAIKFYLCAENQSNLAAIEMLKFLSEHGDLAAGDAFRLLEPLYKKLTYNPRSRKNRMKHSKRYILSSSYSSAPASSSMPPNTDSLTANDIKDAAKFGIKVGAGAVKIAGILTGQPEITAAASGIEKILNAIINGTDD